jgi:hypothetical protein
VSKALFESINEQNYFADDTVIMSETEEGIQQALLNFEQYCDLWKNGKYSGIDGVINEYIKYTIYELIRIFC